jgi:hypothetical protein
MDASMSAEHDAKDRLQPLFPGEDRRGRRHMASGSTV